MSHLINWCRFAANTLVLFFLAPLANQFASGAEDYWGNPGGGQFNVGSNWQDGSAPGPDDFATFGLPENYVVQWNASVGDVINRSLNVPQGDVTFLATVGNHKYSLDDPIEPGFNAGYADISGGHFTLGASSGATFTLEAKQQVTVNNFGSMNVGIHSLLATPYMQLGGGSGESPALAELKVHDGGRVNAETFFIGQDSIFAFAEIQGSSSMVHAGNLFVGGNGGYGDVRVLSSASLVTTQTASLGIDSASSGYVYIRDAGSTWTADSVYVGGTNVKSAGSGAILVENGGKVNANSVSVWSGGALEARGGTITTSDLHLNGGQFYMSPPPNAAGLTAVNITNPSGIFRLAAGGIPSGILALDASTTLAVAGATIIEPGVSLEVSDAVGFHSSQVINNGRIVATGDVVLGNPLKHGAYSGHGQLDIVGSSVTLFDAGYADLGFLTRLDGNLNATHGVSIPAGGELVGLSSTSFVTGKVSAAHGSSIIAEHGDLILGDSGSPVGISIAGELIVNQFQVDLLDQNAAELGSLTTLGRDGMAGTLRAINGTYVDFSDNISGFGEIYSSNDRLKPTVINGEARGDSISEPLEFSGYVTGGGSLDNVTFSGTHSPGSGVAILEVGDVTYTDKSTLIIEVSGNSTSINTDHVISTKSLKLGGKLEIDFITLPSFTLGQSFYILTAEDAIVGRFDTHTFPAIGGGLAFDVLYTDDAILLRVVTDLPGDYNDNGIVDAADYVVWRNSLGQFGVGLAADGDNDDVITQADYNVWKQHFGKRSGAGSSFTLNAAVPEPATFLMVLTGIMITCCRQRTMAS